MGHYPEPNFGYLVHGIDFDTDNLRFSPTWEKCKNMVTNIFKYSRSNDVMFIGCGSGPLLLSFLMDRHVRNLYCCERSQKYFNYLSNMLEKYVHIHSYSNGIFAKYKKGSLITKLRVSNTDYPFLTNDSDQKVNTRRKLIFIDAIWLYASEHVDINEIKGMCTEYSKGDASGVVVRVPHQRGREFIGKRHMYREDNCDIIFIGGCGIVSMKPEVARWKYINDIEHLYMTMVGFSWNEWIIEQTLAANFLKPTIIYGAKVILPALISTEVTRNIPSDPNELEFFLKSTDMSRYVMDSFYNSDPYIFADHFRRHISMMYDEFVKRAPAIDDTTEVGVHIDGNVIWIGDMCRYIPQRQLDIARRRYRGKEELFEYNLASVILRYDHIDISFFNIPSDEDIEYAANLTQTGKVQIAFVHPFTEIPTHESCKLISLFYEDTIFGTMICNNFIGEITIIDVPYVFEPLLDHICTTISYTQKLKVMLISAPDERLPRYARYTKSRRDGRMTSIF